MGADPYAFYTHHLSGVANLHQGLLQLFWRDRPIGRVPRRPGDRRRDPQHASALGQRPHDLVGCRPEIADQCPRMRVRIDHRLCRYFDDIEGAGVIAMGQVDKDPGRVHLRNHPHPQLGHPPARTGLIGGVPTQLAGRLTQGDHPQPEAGKHPQDAGAVAEPVAAIGPHQYRDLARRLCSIQVPSRPHQQHLLGMGFDVEQKAVEHPQYQLGRILDRQTQEHILAAAARTPFRLLAPQRFVVVVVVGRSPLAHHHPHSPFGKLGEVTATSTRVFFA